MASSDEPSPSSTLNSSTSKDTALCLIPPRHLWEPVDRLRSLHDKAYSRWPPHINLVYPFVPVDSLPEAVESIRQLDLSGFIRQEAVLDHVDVFPHKQSNTIHLRPAHGSDAEALLGRLSSLLRGALGREPDEHFKPHMTVAQSYDSQCASHHYLMEKVRALAGLSWELVELAVLVRDRGVGSADSPAIAGGMKVWGYITLDPVEVRRLPKPENLYSFMERQGSPSSAAIESIPQTAYHFSAGESKWTPLGSSSTVNTTTTSVSLDRLIVASYNVLGEFEWPPNQERYPNLIAHMVSDRGAADILVLEEVTDHFLQHLLADDRIRSRYSYATHGPSNQVEVGPLPNHLNIVVLSRFELRWSHLPFQRKHKGASIVTFPTLKDVAATSAGHNPESPELVLAACHLTHGLVDGAVTCKKNEVNRLLDHLATRYGVHPQIIAGDFNVPTSSYTVDMARRTRHMTADSYRYLRDFDAILAEAGWQDAWLASRIQNGESTSAATGPSSYDDSLQEGVNSYEGEQGATFNPLANALAARLVGSGLNNRPQRYDRILVNRHLRLRPGRFNMFGMEETTKTAGDGVGASDHWGIRCLLAAQQQESVEGSRLSAYIRTVKIQRAPASFGVGGLTQLNNLLQAREMLPRDSDVVERREAIHLLGRVLECQIEGKARVQESRGGAQFILTSVGSYGLGVWTRESDLDLLCIGSISHKTFIRLALTRLRKGAPDGISILRKVKASTGTMLLVDVKGIKVDLHYCGAASILEQFPHILNRPSSDPVFALPIQTLYKLKPLRDVSYLRRSIPDMAQYRAAHIFIKTWALSRGLYGPRFGLLGGIHITALLVPIVKMLASHVGSGSVSVADIITTFFSHYAEVDWKTQVVLDPFFFQGGSVNHRRLEREPMCLLGWHAPALNTALNASVSTVHTIAAEMARARTVLIREDMTWDAFLGPRTADGGATDFLKTHQLYVQIEVNYWGSSSQKRDSFVGWLESRCVMLLVDLGRRCPQLAARIWPQRFMSVHDATATAEDSLEYNGCYLIGLDWVKLATEHSDTDDRESVMGELQRVITLFSNRIQGDANYYDPSTCWMGAAAVECKDLDQLLPDDRQVGDDGAGPDDGFDSDEEEDEEEEDVMEAEDDAPRSRLEGRRHGQTAATSNNVTSGTKLRTSTDVMNRIRWDPNLDSADYIIGYDDRFTGIQEKKLDEWKSELTDEEFIPQHRVMYFKRRSDGEIVWDRRTRIDKVFGRVSETEVDYDFTQCCNYI